jgi:hypothetical protein
MYSFGGDRRAAPPPRPRVQTTVLCLDLPGVGCARPTESRYIGCHQAPHGVATSTARRRCDQAITRLGAGRQVRTCLTSRAAIEEPVKLWGSSRSLFPAMSAGHSVGRLRAQQRSGLAERID